MTTIDVSNPYTRYSSTPPKTGGDFMPESLVPQVRICQPGSESAKEAGCQPGEFYLVNPELDEEFGNWGDVIYPMLPDLTLAPAGWYQDAAKFDRGEDVPVCRSVDNINCEGKYAEAAGGKRSKCPHSQWTKEDGKNKPPACPTTYHCMGYSPEVGLPVDIGFRKTASKAHDALADSVTRTGEGKVAAVLSLKKVTSGPLTYYVPEVKEWLAPEEALALQQQGKALMREIAGGGSPPLALVAGQPAQAPDPEPQQQARPSSWSPPPPSANMDDLPF